MHRMKGRDSDDEHPLPIQTYATLKDRQLKEMLQEHDLPVTGNRSKWEQRHQRYALSSFLEAGYIQSFMTRWVMLYNSNLDRSSTNRKSRTELRGDLRKWEEEMSRRKKTAVHNVLEYQVIFGSCHFFCALYQLPWQIQQKDEFVKLVRAAKVNKQPIPSSRSTGSDT